MSLTKYTILIFFVCQCSFEKPSENKNNYSHLFKKDKSYEWLVEPKYEYMSNFSEGLAKIWFEGSYGYINTEGNIIIKPQFDHVEHFQEGMAVVSKENMQYFIDRQGKTILTFPKDWYIYSGFSNGLATIEVDEKFGYIDPKGRWVLKPQFATATSFKHGMASVSTQLWGEPKYINKQGKMIAPPHATYQIYYSEGFGLIQYENKNAYVDSLGTILREFECDVDDENYVQWGMYCIGKFSEGLAHVPIKQINNEWLYGYIDTEGKIVIKPQFRFARKFINGFAQVITKEGDKYLINRNGNKNTVLRFEDYHRLHTLSEGLISVKRREKYGYMDMEGKMIIQPQFESAYGFSDGVASVSIGKNMNLKYGIIKNPTKK